MTTEFEPCFDAADFIRAGRDIFVQRSQVDKGCLGNFSLYYYLLNFQIKIFSPCFYLPKHRTKFLQAYVPLSIFRLQTTWALNGCVSILLQTTECTLFPLKTPIQCTLMPPSISLGLVLCFPTLTDHVTR